MNEYQLDEKLTNLKEDFKRITKEKDLYKEDLETMKTQHHQVIISFYFFFRLIFYLLLFFE